MVHGKSSKGAWTEEEDQLLATWQLEYGNQWSKIAEHIPGKSGQQCAQRWRHRVNPNISKEKWSEEEDSKLLALVKKHGHSWAEIARRLPGRTDQQCMGRWRRHVDPSLRKDRWDDEEDQLLMELVEEYGPSWSEISKHITGRTAHHCRIRWCQLTGAEQPSKSVRSSRSASKSSSSTSSAQHRRLSHSDTAANLRRQSTATAGEGRAQDGVREGLNFVSPPVMTRRPRSARPARQQSSASKADWSDEEDEGELSEDDSPPLTLRKTTARTAGRARAGWAAGRGAQPPVPIVFEGVEEEVAAAAAAAAAPAPEEVPPAPKKAGAAHAGIGGQAEKQAAAGDLRYAALELVTGLEFREAQREEQWREQGAQVQGAAEQGTQEGAGPATAASLAGWAAAAAALPAAIAAAGHAHGLAAAPAAGGHGPHQQEQQEQQQQQEHALQAEPGAGGSCQAPAATGPAPLPAPAWGSNAPAAAAAMAAVEAGLTPPPAATPAATGPGLLARDGSALSRAAAPGVIMAGGVTPSAAVVATFTAGVALEPKRLDSVPKLSIRPLELPPTGTPLPALPQDEESPELTITALGPNLDLLSPSRTLSHVPALQRPQLTPPTSGRKRPLPTARMAALGPRLAPLILPDDGGAKWEQLQALGTSPPGGMTPLRPTPGARDEEACALQWGGLTPSVLTLLQSPQPGSCSGDDPLVSPHFGGMLTPEWAKKDPSRQITSADGSQRRLSSGRSRRVRAEGHVAGAVASLDFTLMGNSPKKVKTEDDSPPVASGPGPGASGPPAPGMGPGLGRAYEPGRTQSAATAAHLLLPETVGRSALAAALQQGLGLASTARTGHAGGLPLGGTLTGMKGAADAQQAQQDGEGAPLTSDSVRVQLRTLLENL